MTEILQQVQAKADIVIIDAPPVLPVTDAVVLAQRVDGVLVVVRDSQTKVGAVTQTVEQLRRVGTNVIGLVVNDIATGRLSYGYHYGRYAKYYHYESQEEASKPKRHAWLRRKLARQAHAKPGEQRTHVMPALHEEDSAA
jgi:Mrp family chromosome partitioning ATPase